MTDSMLEALDRRLAAGDEPLPAFKAALRSSRAMLKQRFEQGTRAALLVRQAALFTDALLERAWNRFLPCDSKASLIAVGGYGRGELHPASDIDVMILTSGDPLTLAANIEPFVVFLWDIGLEIGHSVRSIEQCVHEAGKDITVITTVMECRFVAGDRSLFALLNEAISPQQMWPSREFFSAKIQEQKIRYAKFDDSGQNLEPNIKEGPGGLRDIQTIAWVAKRHFGVRSMAELVERKFLSDREYRKLKRGEEHLWRVRYALHLLTGRHEDRLLFEHQRTLAKQFGYTDASANLAVEQFMQDYYRRVIEMQRLNEMLLQLFDEAILMNGVLGPPQPINRRFQIRNGYLEVVNSAIFARYPLAMLELFLVLQQNPQLQGVRASTIRSIRAHRHLIDERFRNDLRARALFLEIFREQRGLTHATRRMHRYGILARYIPQFHAITGLMQFDLFHVYTVDEHILMVIRNLRRFSLDQHANECPRCNRVYKQIPKPELLYLAALFHDVAKGRGGDHSTLGAEDAREFCARHDLSDFDSKLVAWLVKNHLVMSHTAQHRDIDDPDVIQEFATLVQSRVRLDYLYLLTVADMRGTNPSLWNSWKAALLDHLHARTSTALERGIEHPQEQDEVIAQRQAEARIRLLKNGYDYDDLNLLWMTLSTDYFLQHSVDAIVWHTQTLWPPGRKIDQINVALRDDSLHRCTELFAYGPDRDNLFAQSAALLTRLGLNILSARIQTTDQGMSINSFLVLEDDGERISGEERQQGIRYFLEDGLNNFDQPLSPPMIPRQLRSFQTPSEISFEQDQSRHFTLLHLKTSDRPGLLSMVGQVFADHQLRLHHARISTAGAEALDSFAITDRNDRPIQDQTRLDTIAGAISQRLDAP